MSSFGSVDLTSVGVKTILAEETDEGLAGILGKREAEAGGGGKARDQRDAGGERFLHDLKRDAPRDEQAQVGPVAAPIEQGAAEDLVDCVVAPDVLTRHEHLAVRIERARGMARYQRLGVEMMSVGDMKDAYPFLETHDLAGALYDPADGDIDPAQLTQALAKADEVLLKIEEELK